MSLERSSIRRLLRELLRDDSGFDAFCLDYFLDIHARFAAGMDRVAKTNLLLQLANPEDLVNAINHYKGISSQNNSAASINKEVHDVALDRLYEEREVAIISGQSTQRIDTAILALKRQMRRGPQLNAGEVLGDRYRLVRILGYGGFAHVWLAWDLVQKQHVAIKVLHSRFGSLGAEDEHVKRVARGARTMARLSLQHPGFVRVLSEDLSTEEGFHYFAMELLHGGDLRKAIISRKIDYPRRVAVILEVGAALQFAHQQGLIHRDIKPQNILLDQTNHGKITDFDLVTVSHSTGGTRTGAMGTFIYSPPEEMENAKSVDLRADVYALGMTAIFAIYGKDIPSQIMKSSQGFISNLECKLGMKIVLGKAISWDREERYGSIAEFCRDLQSALQDRFVFPYSQVHELAEDDFEELPEENHAIPCDRIGPYRLVRYIRKDALGEVFEAKQEPIERQVALKIIDDRYRSNALMVTQFFDEAKAANMVNHSGIRQVHDYGRLGDGASYLTMEWVNGETLNEFLHRFNKGLGIEESINIGWQVASALNALHQKGLVHCNVSSHNIILALDPLVRSGKRVKITDFGMVKRTKEIAAYEKWEQAEDVVMGTPRYMAPERCRLTSGSAATSRNLADISIDVYALGILLYEMIAGKPPFQGASMELVAYHIYEPPPPLIHPQLPDSLARLVKLALAKDKNERPTMNQMLDTLERLTHEV